MDNKKDNFNTDGLLKISDIVEATGVNYTTIKYYIKEGLIEIACKTGRNMAYYSPDSVERVKMIRTLQNEKFYPLAVIKHVLSSKTAGFKEYRLLDVINKADKSVYNEQIPYAEAIKKSELRTREADALARAGLIRVGTVDHERVCTREDYQLMKLVKLRLNANIPLEQTIYSFLSYEEKLREAVELDVESLVRECLLAKSLTTEEIMNVVNVSDDTLDSFIDMRRYRMNASLGAAYIAKTEKLQSQLKLFGKGLVKALIAASEPEIAVTLEEVLAGKKSDDETYAAFGEVLGISEADLANALTILFKSGKYFRQPAPRSGCDTTDMVHDALVFGWQTFAPAEFGCDPQEAKKDFVNLTSDQAFVDAVIRLTEKLLK